MAPPTSGHGRSPSNIAEHIQLVLDRETSHENLQYVKVQMDKELAEERRRIEDPDEFKKLSTLSNEQLQSRVAALQGLQAILRAFLRRVKNDTDALFHFVPGLHMPFVSSAAPGEEDEHDLYGRDFDL
eukprot:evm.model.NODE_33736_length_26119_cov_21.157280.1